MTVALRVVVDQMVAPTPGGIGRYTEELTKALIETAPRGCEVIGVVSSISPNDQTALRSRLPGLASLEVLRLDRRQLAAAWQYGWLGSARRGIVHATSLLAPLARKRSTSEDPRQVAVTIHDVVPWTHPETLTPRGVSWHKAMAKRARKYADAIVVPSHAVAHELEKYIGGAERYRVIGGAVSPRLAVPGDADERAKILELPEEFVLAVGTLEPRKGLRYLIEAMAHPAAPDLPLVVAGPKGWGDVDVASLAEQTGLDADRIRVLGFLSDSDLALVFSRAKLFVYPSLAEGFGLPVLEALSLGTPVIHSDAPALLEIADSAGVVVPREDLAGYPERLAHAIGALVADTEFAQRLRIAGLDRARSFSWRDSAEKTWQLHADL